MKRNLLAIAACLITATSAADLSSPQIAIIIDDLGNARAAGERAIALPGQITFSILPNTPGAKALATAAHESGREVMLHLPLQAMDDAEISRDVIHLDMSHAQFSEAFDNARKSVPFAVGVNNHRGSLITRHPGHMRWLMDNIREKTEWFFVDSYTTHHSVALQVAEEAGVAALKRDVFLDSSRAPEDILLAIEKVKATALRTGSAIAIGHPYPETLDALERVLPDLEQQGFKLVSVSRLMQRH